MKYRPEIDGLRTIAVVAVVLYHAEYVFKGANPFAGGFIGVDIFFVISGYLITTIIVREISEKRFTFANFYERRARRILPALFLVIIVSIPLAMWLMLPKALEEFSGSVLSSIFFSSNIWFWLEDSYTAEPSKLKPFLHTWTLAVEEQFYIFFPIIVMAISAWFKRYLTGILFLILLASLQLAQYGSLHFPDANFYLIQSRAWELMAGALLAKLELEHGKREFPFWSNIMPLLGASMIFYAIFAFDDGMRHPSYMTAIPVFGTVLMIAFMRKGELVTDILSWKPIVWIGLVSYSFYLWHYPAFAFGRLYWGELDFIQKTGLVLLSLALAAVSYYVVETPFRRKTAMPTKRFIGVAVASSVVLIGCSAALYSTGGNLPGQPTFELADVDLSEESVEANKNRRFDVLGARCSKLGWDSCDDVIPGKFNILVIGDSHGPDALNAIAAVHPEVHFVKSFQSGCPPHPEFRTITTVNHPNLVKCEEVNDFRFDPASLEGIDLIVINYLSGWYKPEYLEPYLRFLQETTDKPVLLFGNYIVLDALLPDILKAEGLEGVDNHIQSEFLYEDELKAVADKYGAEFISKRVVCDGADCPLFTPDGTPFSWDKHHLSLEFAEYLGQEIAPVLDRYIKTNPPEDRAQ